MSTLVPIAHVVHQALPAGSTGTSTQGDHGIYLIVVIIVVILLTTALKQLRRATAPIGELVRLVMAALGVGALLLAAIGLLIVTLFLSH
jgi:integral membrane sensor domain MASE1